jgi:two-component system NarL family sensor kinase
MESASLVKLYFGIITAILAFLIITVGFVIVVIRYQKRLLSKQQEILITDANHKKELLQSSVQSAETERQQIAKDVHDEIGSIFSTLAISVNRFSDGNLSDKEHIENSRNLIQMGINNVRRISHAIVPFELELLGLEQTLENHFETLQKSAGINVSFESTLILNQLNKEASSAIYRIVQELSSNCLKYANSNEIKLSIKEENGQLLIIYNDQGIGTDLNLKANKIGIGLKNIESRALLLNGLVEFKSSPGNGFQCQIHLPLTNNIIT